jgi:hypothetical protein
MKEVNTSYFQKLLDIGRFSISDRNFYQSVLNSIKKQGSKATDRQYNIIKQIEFGKTSYSSKNEHIYNKNNIMNQNIQLRQLIRESIQEYIREVETSGNVAAQEAKIRACEEAIALREKKANMEGLDEAYHDMMDSNKINELKKEIKELQKYKSKAEKVLEKMRSKAEGKTTKKNTEDTTDESIEEEAVIDEVSIDENDPESGPQLEETEQVYETLLWQKRAGIISETEYVAKLEEAKKKMTATQKEKKEDIVKGMKKSKKVSKIFGADIGEEDIFGKVSGQTTLDDSFSSSSAHSPELKTDAERLRAAAKLFEQQLKAN